MNAISKKLLSMLVVVAMVLSMVPFGGLSIFAVETNATEAEVAETVTPGQANLPEGIQEIIDEAAKVVNTDEAIQAHIDAGTCPMCGATGIEWVRKTAGTSLAGTQDQAVHAYYDSALSISGNVVAMYDANSVKSQNNTLCVALKSTAVISNTGTRFLMASGTNNVFNIMGSGKVTTNVGTGTDYGMFQLGSSTVNLYGGTYVLEDADGKYAAVRANGGNLNIFNDATIGPETVDTTKPLYNVTFNSVNSVVNMYGGTIRNGVTAKNGLSGNVTVAKGTFNMYGGTISGGQYLSGEGLTTPASVGGNVVVGGLAEGGTSSTSGKFYMYGGTITGGKAYNGGNGGGNINCYNNTDANVMELMGGVISDGYARAAGGNVQIQGGKNHKIGGTVLITNGSAASGGNIHVQSNMKLTMEGGYIQGGALATSSQNATNGGGVYVAGTFDMTGGEIDGCTASGNGGNIYSYGGGTVNVGANAVIKNGLSKSAANGGGGGNVYLAATSSAGSTMTTSGVITGGTVNGGSSMLSAGGNIAVCANGGIQSVLTVNGGEISNGKLAYATANSSFGGNIRAYNCKVVINDGLIYGGDGGNKSTSNVGVQGDTSGSANTDCTLEINGGIIVGDIQGSYAASGKTSGNYTYTASVKLTGTPKIVNSYELADGTTVTAKYGALSVGLELLDISGLEAGAQIEVTASVGKVLTKATDNAAAVASGFSCTASDRIVELQSDDTLKVVEKPVQAPEVGVFEPWNCGGMAYCPACGNTAAVAWTELDSSHAAGYIDGHYYLTEDITEASVYVTGEEKAKSAYIMPTSGKIACVNLNGHDLTVTDGCALFGANGTLNMIDTAKEQGTVSGGNTTSSGATIQLNGGNGTSKVNLYGGIYTKIADTGDAPIVAINANGGTLNMHGGVIDGTGKTTNTYASCVNMQGSVGGQYSAQAIFNMYGGKILGGTSTGNGGAIRVGSANADTVDMSYCNAAVFNLYGGEIIGGTAQGNNGGGVFYIYGNTVNIYGGTVKDGVAVNHGGNFFLEQKTTKNADGTAGTPVPGTLNISGGTVSGGTVPSSKNGGSMVINIGSVLNMTGGTVYGGTAGNQGGILRAYKATVSMSGDAVMYAGTANGTSKTHGVWLVDSDMTMTDNATVYGPEGAVSYANAISLAQYEAGSSLTLDGNATVKAVTGESRNCIQVANSAAYPNTLMISNDWTGEAYITTYKEGGTSYARGETIDNALAVCGSLVEGVPTKGGSYEGKLYYGPQNNAQILGVEGDLVVGLVAIKAADGETWYATNEEAFEDYYANGGFEAGSYILLGNEGEITLAGDAYVDSRGYAVTVDGVGTLYAMDNANDDYVGYGTWTIVSADVEVATDVENAVKDRRYIVIDMAKDDEGNRRVTAHRLEMGLSAVSLRASQAGLYYKAAYSCDTSLASRISAYGVVLSVNDMPGADFLDDPTDGFSCYESGFAVNEDNNYTVNATSGAVFGIFKTEENGRDADTNAEYGKMKIYANTYIMVDTQDDNSADNDVALVGDNANAGTKGGNAYSLFDVLKAIDDNWAEYADVQAQVTEFYNTWAELGMNQYADEFTNIA